MKKYVFLFSLVLGATALMACSEEDLMRDACERTKECSPVAFKGNEDVDVCVDARKKVYDKASSECQGYFEDYYKCQAKASCDEFGACNDAIKELAKCGFGDLLDLIL